MKFNLTWDITQKCNETCEFCYRNKKKKDISLEENIKILENLYSSNIINKITMCGGEPLVYNDLFNLLESVEKPKDVKLSIVTNGICLANYLEEENRFEINIPLIEKVVNNFEWICFSIDASNSETEVEVTRNKEHFDRIMFILSYLNNNYENINIKINSIVTKKNYLDIPNLYETLIEYKNIKRWKLFRYLGNTNLQEINKRFEISDGEFDIVLKFVELVNNQKLRISVNNTDDYNGTYIMLKQDGTVEVSDNGKLKEILDLKEDDIIKILDMPQFNKEKHIKSRVL